MYWYAFNVGDYRSHTAHLTPIEHYIYRSLIDWYYLNERPMPANDIDYIAKVLLLKTDEEKQALQSVLAEFFKIKKLKITGDTVECYHHARIDVEIKNYHHRNGGRVYDHTGEVTQGNNIGNNENNIGNNSGNKINVTNNQKGNKLTQAERTAKSKAERKKIIHDLQEMRVDFDSNASLKELREIYAQFFGECSSNMSNTILETGNDFHNTEIGNGNTGNNSGNNGNFESNAFPYAITSNQEPRTQEPLTKVNNNTTTAGEKNFDIRNWNAPSYENALSLFSEKEIYMALSEVEYLDEVEKFKDYNANQVAQGKPPLADSGYRKSKFIDWFQILSEKKKATSAPVKNDDDLPASFRQSANHHSPTKSDPKTSVFLNGLWKPCLPGMTVDETYAYIETHKEVGFNADEIYDRVYAEMTA